jgi:ATP-dependent RNA helicase RhlE
MKALKTEGYSTPTPIQERVIPIILEKKDLIGCAQTGTGKTAAFAIPLLQILHEERAGHGPRRIRTLILTPTRELAIQIGESFSAYGCHTGIRHTVIFGGVSQKAQTDALHAGVQILIATPGRLLDLMDQGFVDLRHLCQFVLDEADRMLDMGFIHDVKKIIAKLPKARQTLLFSATMPPAISKLADTILSSPVRVAVTPVASTVESIDQSVYFVGKKDKKRLLAHIMKDPSVVTALVFTRTKRGANIVARDLSEAGIGAEAIHGNKSQGARQRALGNFKARRTRVLVATDIAARGLDIDEISHVINYELPNIPETYVHRIGRTGRAGLSGTAISFCEPEEREYLTDIEKLIKKRVPVIRDHPFASADVEQSPRREPLREKPAPRQGVSARPAPSSPARSGSRRFTPRRFGR